MARYIHSSVSMFLAITIGFLNASYTVSEGVGNAGLMIGVTSGDLETNIVVNISTAEDSALCEFIIFIATYKRSDMIIIYLSAMCLALYASSLTYSS